LQASAAFRSKRYAGTGFITAFVDAASLEGITRLGYKLIIDQRRSTGQFVHAGLPKPEPAESRAVCPPEEDHALSSAFVGLLRGASKH